MSDWECPKCKTEYEGSGHHEDDSGEQTCDSCGFKFIVEIDYMPTYDTRCDEHLHQFASAPGHLDFCIYCGSGRLRLEKDN